MALTPIYNYPVIPMSGSEQVPHDDFVNAVTGTQNNSIVQITERELNNLNQTKLTIHAKTTAEWEADLETVIRAGELGFDTSREIFRMGNGANIWNDLDDYLPAHDILSGGEPPTSSTAGVVGQLYVYVGSDKEWFYICRNVLGSVYIWEQLAYASEVGDMLKSVYDTNNNGVVDDAERLGGRLPSEYLIEETDPTVPEWAKEESKPSYTAAEVGASPSLHASQHALGENDMITPLSIGAADSIHASSHEIGGSDEISIIDIGGAEQYHAHQHEPGGDDEIDFSPYAKVPVVFQSSISTTWSGQNQVISDSRIFSSAAGDFYLAQSATADEFKQFGELMPHVTAQADGSITITYRGKANTIAIPVEIEVRA